MRSGMSCKFELINESLTDSNGIEEKTFYVQTLAEFLKLTGERNVHAQPRPGQPSLVCDSCIHCIGDVDSYHRYITGWSSTEKVVK